MTDGDRTPLTPITTGRPTRAARLARAIENGELELQHQPIVSLPDGGIENVEALVRWRERGVQIPPSTFVPQAERSGLARTLGAWVLDAALATARRWHDAGLDVGISINCSPQQLARRGLAHEVSTALRKHGVAPRFLTIEITEAGLHAPDDDLDGTLRRLRDLGVSLAIDDFGAGYSSLGRLGQLPITHLKIDGRFLRGLPGDRRGSTILSAVLSLARALDLHCTAEGVESAEQLAVVERLGYRAAQGFHLYPPLSEPAARVVLELRGRRRAVDEAAGPG